MTELVPVPPRDEVVGASRSAARALAGLAAVGAAGIGYAWWEARWFALRTATVPVLPAGAPDLRVLHVSDFHLTPSQRRKQDWIASLAALEPDLVIDTGDNLAHQQAVDPLIESLGTLLDRPGAFVLGSNDYFEPTMRNPAAYLYSDSGHRHIDSAPLPWKDLVARKEARGWTYLANQRATITVKDVRIAFTGVDDPHLRYDELSAVAGPADPTADVRIGVSHAPYLRVLDQFATDGYDAIFAGHTHGGQLCLPFNRALVTNCDLEPARASGLHRHPVLSRPGDPGSAWLHVSAGAGTSPYVPLRFCCRPEATLLTLTSDFEGR